MRSLGRFFRRGCLKNLSFHKIRKGVVGFYCVYRMREEMEANQRKWVVYTCGGNGDVGLYMLINFLLAAKLFVRWWESFISCCLFLYRFIVSGFASHLRVYFASVTLTVVVKVEITFHLIYFGGGGICREDNCYGDYVEMIHYSLLRIKLWFFI